MKEMMKKKFALEEVQEFIKINITEKELEKR